MHGAGERRKLTGSSWCGARGPRRRLCAGWNLALRPIRSEPWLIDGAAAAAAQSGQNCGTFDVENVPAIGSPAGFVTARSGVSFRTVLATAALCDPPPIVIVIVCAVAL